MAHQLVLITGFHDNSNTSNQVCRLHSHRSSLVIQAPFDSSRDLLEVWFAAFSQGHHHSPKPIKHNLTFSAKVTRTSHTGVNCLFLECIKNTIDQSLLETLIDVSRTQVLKHFLDGFHHHATIRFGVILEIINDSTNDIRAPNLVSKFFCSLDDLIVVAPIECHTANPKILEKFWQDFSSDIVWLDSSSGNTLLNNLQYNSLHFFIRRVKLS
mmetsp:Transcript_42100/g.101538  ORF Transcript_42100/g.101538 Transcript_42100/m.101538 type:complete len:212 (-) Transcript_42100:2198-2833(-)